MRTFHSPDNPENFRPLLHTLPSRRISLSEIPLPLDIAGLTPVQVQVAVALAAGATVSSAAESAGLHRSTVHLWMKDSPGFVTAVKAARFDFASSLRDRLRDLSALALQVLEDVMRNPEAPASARLKAALAVLNRPTFPKGAWSLPAPIEPQQEREFMRESDLLNAEYRNLVARQALRRAARREESEQTVEQSSDEEIANPLAAPDPSPAPVQRNSTLFDTISEVSPRPAASVSHKVGRNEPCPCRSGQKFKRCCGKVTQAA